MKTRPLLKTLMTPFPYSVDLNADLKQAKALMDSHGVRHLPVTKDNVLVGVITEGDMNAASANCSDSGSSSLKVRDAYVSDVYVVDLDEPIDNVLLTMAARHIGSALVTRKGKLAGVFTSNDACRCFGEYIRQRFPKGGGDEAA